MGTKDIEMKAKQKEAPEAPASPRDITYHGITVHDPFAGLKDED